MSDNQNVERYSFYSNYNWLPSDFLNFQTNMDQSIGNLSNAFGKQAILRGFGLNTNPANLAVTVGVGSCISSNNQICAVSGISTITLAAPSGGNPAWSLLVATPTLTDTNQIANPSNP